MIETNNTLSPTSPEFASPNPTPVPSTPPPKWRISNPWVSVTLLISSIVGGLGGAVLVGFMLENIARPILGLQDPNMPLIITLILGLTVLMIIGTVALVLAFYVENTVMKIFIIAFSVPIPIIFEVIDLTIRFVNILKDAQSIMIY